MAEDRDGMTAETVGELLEDEYTVRSLQKQVHSHCRLQGG